MPRRSNRARRDPSSAYALALRTEAPDTREADASRQLLVRLLDAPDLARVVPQMAPESLHQLIRHCGLDACGTLVASATPAQMTAILDLDLWRPATAGQDHRLDAERFGEWLEALVDTGPDTAARIVAAMEVELVVAALSSFVRVFDPGVFEPTFQTDDEVPLTTAFSAGALECAVGGYLVRGGPRAWDAIVGLLVALETDHPASFHAIMRGCRRLSNSTPEVDGLDELLGAPEQAVYEVAGARELRQSDLGYSAPADARAFLAIARQRPLEPSTSGAAFWAGGPVEQSGASLVPAGAEPPRLGHLHAFLSQAREIGEETYAARAHELAFLTNTLAAGCSIQDRPLTPQEASDAALSTCNLGLELSAAHASHSPSGLDLVRAFEIGWSALHSHVALFAAGQLLATLQHLRCVDAEVQLELRTLRIELTKQREARTPWHARRALDVLQMLDPPCWAVLRGLLDECPTMPGALAALLSGRARTFSATAFAFMSTTSHVAHVQEFTRRLPEWLAS